MQATKNTTATASIAGGRRTEPEVVVAPVDEVVVAPVEEVNAPLVVVVPFGRVPAVKLENQMADCLTYLSGVEKVMYQMNSVVADI